MGHYVDTAPFTRSNEVNERLVSGARPPAAPRRPRPRPVLFSVENEDRLATERRRVQLFNEITCTDTFQPELGTCTSDDSHRGPRPDHSNTFANTSRVFSIYSAGIHWNPYVHSKGTDDVCLETSAHPCRCSSCKQRRSGHTTPKSAYAMYRESGTNTSQHTLTCRLCRRTLQEYRDGRFARENGACRSRRSRYDSRYLDYRPLSEQKSAELPSFGQPGSDVQLYHTVLSTNSSMTTDSGTNNTEHVTKRNLYNEGISDSIMNLHPVSPPPPVCRTSCPSQTPARRTWPDLPGVIPHAHRPRSRYHDECRSSEPAPAHSLCPAMPGPASRQPARTKSSYGRSDCYGNLPKKLLISLADFEMSKCSLPKCRR